jgi:hypothetical protein
MSYKSQTSLGLFLGAFLHGDVTITFWLIVLKD